MSASPDALGAAGFYRWRHPGMLPILMCHGVVDEPLPADCRRMISVRDFTTQLEWLARR